MARLVVVTLVVVAIVAYVVVQLLRPVPSVAVSAGTVAATMPGAASTLAWPAAGEAAIGIEGGGLLDSTGAQRQTPLASVTKIMTAYVVLHDHPLAATSSGPQLTVAPGDVTTYQQDLANGDSVVKVVPGEQLDELQALQALLIPSGDNIATLLADWDAGSEAAFVAKMNAAAAQLGLHHTHYTDASGVAPGTVSTAADQVRLAIAAMQLPAFRSVVGMAQVTLPVAGLQYNVDSQIGKNGIIGVKTGFTTSSGGCFVFAATTTVTGKAQTVVGAVLGQPATASAPSALTNAFSASQALLTSADHVLEQATVVHAGATLGHLDAAWAGAIALRAAHAVTLTGLPGQRGHLRVELPEKVHAPIAAHTRIGTAIVTLGDQSARVPLVTASALPAVSTRWRLTHL